MTPDPNAERDQRILYLESEIQRLGALTMLDINATDKMEIIRQRQVLQDEHLTLVNQRFADRERDQ